MVNYKTTALLVNDCGGIKLDQQSEGERLRTLTAFFMFGTLIYATFSLVLAGAQDILAGTLVPTSMVLLVSIVPAFLVNLIAPYFIQKIPYFARISTFCCTGIVGLLMLALAKQVHWRLVGVGLVTFGEAVGEITSLALTSFYHEVTSTAFSAGTGMGFVIAPLYYIGMCQYDGICIFISFIIIIIIIPLFVAEHAQHPYDLIVHFENTEGEPHFCYKW